MSRFRGSRPLLLPLSWVLESETAFPSGRVVIQFTVHDPAVELRSSSARWRIQLHGASVGQDRPTIHRASVGQSGRGG